MLSIHLLMKNEEAMLPGLFESLRQLDCVGEIIAVDTGSNDNSMSVARDAGAMVVSTPLSHDFASARNAGLRFVRYPWVFQIDADERISLPLAVYLNKFASATRVCDAVWVYRENRIDGKLLGAGRGHEWHLRLFRRGNRFVGRIHEGVRVPETRCLTAPKSCLLLHHKTLERQERQNTFYDEWPEQRRVRYAPGDHPTSRPR